MRLPRPRFTIRHLIIVVAAAAIVWAAATLQERRRLFQRIAANNETTVRVITTPGAPRFPENIIEWHSEMQKKYEYAAGHPWLPVAPDRPVPEWPRVVPSPGQTPAP